MAYVKITLNINFIQSLRLKHFQPFQWHLYENIGTFKCLQLVKTHININAKEAQPIDNPNQKPF